MIYKCNSCGKRYTIDYDLCPNCGGYMYVDSNNKKNSGKDSAVLNIISFFAPGLGIILYFINRKSQLARAQGCLKSALISTILILLSYIDIILLDVTAIVDIPNDIMNYIISWTVIILLYIWIIIGFLSNGKRQTKTQKKLRRYFIPCSIFCLAFLFAYYFDESWGLLVILGSLLILGEVFFEGLFEAKATEEELTFGDELKAIGLMSIMLVTVGLGLIFTEAVIPTGTRKSPKLHWRDGTTVHTKNGTHYRRGTWIDGDDI